ncbi:hypothetical protein [Streptomyces sp. NPDC059909]|uniref:hypothetical protein n=1 Tax=Streptomyces sp. NPDC059909 TaxID=3346998 RepID=UPI00365485BA
MGEQMSRTGTHALHAEERAWPEIEEVDQREALATITPHLLRQVETQLVPHARLPDEDEYQRRLAADIAVVRAVRADGYTGDRTTETLLAAVPFFRRYAPQQGHWDPRRGAGLATYFMGACVSCFAVTYRKWWKQQLADQRLARWDDSSEALIQLPDPRAPDPCQTALVHDEVSRTLTRIQDPKLKQAMGLRALGYTEREAAESVGLTAKALERRSSKQRDKLRSTDSAATDCLGEGSGKQ